MLCYYPIRPGHWLWVRPLAVAFLLSLSLVVSAQQVSRSLFVRHITEPITLDGTLDEEVWHQADSSADFSQNFPTDTIQAIHQTTIRALYDDNTLYLSIYAIAPHEDYVVSTLRRDFRGSANDNVSMMFDPFRDGTNAFQFGATPYGVRREALISGGGADISGFNNTWDIKWKAESRIYGNHYIIEMAIPFSSVKFPEGSKSWRFQAYRFNLQTNEQSTWVRVPQNQILINLAFMGDLVFEQPLGKSRRLVALIPYVNGLAQQDFENDDTDQTLSVGGDAKVAIGTGMNLDITVNPDFSNVEVDDIFTNLTRFEVQLPEKRQFFIDNSDLFASFGSPRDASPFFSRRIGLARDTADELIENRILGGVRLSGKLDENWRLGVLNIQTVADTANEIASNNNMMVALQRKVFARSNVGAFFINRETFADYDFLDSADRYNRVAGAEFNLASSDNVWSGKVFLQKSFQPGDNQRNLASEATLVYNTREWEIMADLVYIDEDFQSDLGFIPRTDVFKIANGLTRTFYPTQGRINSSRFRVFSLLFWRPNLGFKWTDQELRGSWRLTFKDRSTIDMVYSNQFVYLTDEFDPTRTDGGIALPGDSSYRFSSFNAEYQTNRASLVTFTGNMTAGQLYTGSRFSAGGELGFRVQPWAQIGFNLNYDQIRLPDPHPSADLWLVTTRLDVTFSKTLFWSTLVQYSNQRDNLGINSRLQWRFAPLSDLYLVYNDNYYTQEFGPRFRSINLKISYWLNV